MKLTRSLFVGLLCTLMSIAAFAQSVNVTTGSIGGKVTDNSGAGLPGVTVTATNLDTGLTRSNVSENDGTYTLNLLPPGNYKVAGELSGLGGAHVPRVVVLLGNMTKTDLKLTPSVSEAITVTATAPIVDPEKTGLTTSVTNQQIENLPIIGRDFRSLTALTPGISVGSFDGQPTAGGARPLSTDYNIDGANSDNDFFGQQTGGTRAPFTFSQAAIKEFQVVRSEYDAEYGRGVGAVVNAITKSGTNNVDGEAFYFTRNKNWAGTRPVIINNLKVADTFSAKSSKQPGFAVGGPIMRDKLFYFLNGDGQRQQLPVIIGNDMRLSSPFTSLTAAQQQAVLDKIQAVVGAPYASGLNYNQTFNENAFLAKFDLNASSGNHWSVRANTMKFTNQGSGSNTTFGLNQTQEIDKFYQAVVEGDSVFSNNMFNQFIGQKGRDQRPVTALTSGTEFSINFGTTQFFGAADTTPNTADEKKWQLRDTFNYMYKGHQLKVGADVLHRHLFDSFPRFVQNGLFAFTSSGSNSALVQFLNNTPNTFQQAYGPLPGNPNGDVAWDSNLWGTFVNDEFHVGKKLTVDAGLRYDYEKTPVPSGNAYPQHPEFLSQIKNDKNNIAPRLGFAYDVFGNGRSVVRGGSGKFFEYMPDILLASPIQGISGALVTSTFTCSASTHPCPTFPNLLSPSQFLSQAALSANLVTIGPNYQAQEAWRSNLQFEQQIGNTYSASVGAVYSKLTHVQGTKNINLVPTGVTLGNMPVYDYNSSSNALRPYNDMGIIREITSNEDAWYRGQTIEFHKLALGDSKISWDLNYTHSTSIDEETNTRSTSTTFLIDPNNPKLSEGTSDNDVPNRVSGDFTYRFPHGFMLSGVAFWQTGFPWTNAISFTCTGCTANSLTGQAQTSQAANFTPVFVNSSGDVIDITAANGMTKQQFSDFLAAQGGHLISRNTYRQPNVWDADLRLSKTFDLPRGTQFQILAECFNIFNQQIGNIIGANQDSFKVVYTASSDKYTITKFTNANASGTQVNTFGQVQGYSSLVDPRTYQIAFKFIF
ncbi:MAG TPA: carboxypeptidase regulatory-like domain-containing protein [Thermoanaerobaculia bacterium]|nr:carboxypeptidase regulatory-like domain-containing protein [Thermoanaerobaculia bacterium]